MSAMLKDMVPVTSTVLYQEKVTTVPTTVTAGDDLWMTLPDLEAVSGWELEPEGICREGLCVPIPGDKVSLLLRQGTGGSWFNLAEFARLIEQPVAHDTIHNVWYFGPPAWEWRSRLGSPVAPDFTLPDLTGNTFSLSNFRGKKVLLACWASW